MDGRGPDDRPELKVDIVIPVLNEAHVLADSVATLRAFATDSLSDYQWIVTIVDNGSTDGTADVGTQLAEQFSDVFFTSLTDLRRKLMRYIRHYNKAPKPIKWMYRDPTNRITAGAKLVGTVH